MLPVHSELRSAAHLAQEQALLGDSLVDRNHEMEFAREGSRAVEQGDIDRSVPRRGRVLGRNVRKSHPRMAGE